MSQLESTEEEVQVIQNTNEEHAEKKEMHHNLRHVHNTNKKAKPIDFIDYANKHGITYNIIYADKEKTLTEKPNKFKFKSEDIYKKNLVKPYTNNFDNLNQEVNKNDFTQVKTKKKKAKKIINNKFDSMNKDLNPYMNTNFSNNLLHIKMNNMLYGQLFYQHMINSTINQGNSKDNFLMDKLNRNIYQNNISDSLYNTQFDFVDKFNTSLEHINKVNGSENNNLVYNFKS